jgi:hypothetical protein
VPFLRWPSTTFFLRAGISALPARAPGRDLAELSFEPEVADEHEARAPMPGDRAAARRMIREGQIR